VQKLHKSTLISTIRHLVKQPEITAKNMRKTNNKVAPDIRDTFIILNWPKTKRQYAIIQHKYAHMRDSLNKYCYSILPLHNNNRVGIRQSLPYINATHRQ